MCRPWLLSALSYLHNLQLQGWDSNISNNINPLGDNYLIIRAGWRLLRGRGRAGRWYIRRGVAVEYCPLIDCWRPPRLAPTAESGGSFDSLASSEVYGGRYLSPMSRPLRHDNQFDNQNNMTAKAGVLWTSWSSLFQIQIKTKLKIEQKLMHSRMPVADRWPCTFCKSHTIVVSQWKGATARNGTMCWLSSRANKSDPN